MSCTLQSTPAAGHTGWLGPMDYWHRNAPAAFNPAYRKEARAWAAATSASMEADGYYDRHSRAECAAEWQRRYNLFKRGLHMIDVQEVMRRIIRHGFYSGRCAFMCNAAKEAYRQDLIRRDECWAVVEAAEAYIDQLVGAPDSATMYTMGEACGIEWPDGPHLDTQARSADYDRWALQVGRVLYWNWDKRPR